MTFHPPSGVGHGVSGSMPPLSSSPSAGGVVGGSVSVRRAPSHVPITVYSPHVVPLEDSWPVAAAQSQPTTSGPLHCGGYDVSITLHSCGPWSGPSSTVYVPV